ncbi:MAG: hypothetical protein IJO26_00880 [Clostridium sp.]|nr:hypothetical protein [Clostridium sp.]
MSKSNNKKSRTNGTIQMKNKNIAIPVRPNNTTTLNLSNNNNNELRKVNKTNQLY